MNIILVGFMGSGKTSVGHEIARRTGFRFLDTDELIVSREGASIPAIFRDKGEPYFRELESEIIAEVSYRTNLVISTGGGAVQNPENVRLLRQTGALVWLKTSPEVILRRTMSEQGARPLLNVQEPLREINRLLRKRAAYYEQADLAVDTSYITIGEAAQEICDQLGLGGQRLEVSLGDRSYEILLNPGILRSLSARLWALRPSRIAVVSNPTVHALYGPRVAESLRARGLQFFPILVPDGEEYKDLLWLYKVLGDLLRHGCDRRSVVVALGGGVVGDMAGFAAATFMRGIRCVQVPTTLLAQVDSSVGGKTGVNHPLGKNMIGAFHQPSLVVIDPETLQTLPQREFRAGLAEVIKYGVIWDAELFEMLVRDRKDICALGPRLHEAIVRSCRIKATVVGQDEKESGVRAILNFGHTVGHALEAVTGYRRYLHGEAVAVGMCAASDLGVRTRLLARQDARRIVNLIHDYGLPTRIPSDLSLEAMARAMLHDKKAEAGKVKFVLPTAIGMVRLVDHVPSSKVRETLEACQDK